MNLPTQHRCHRTNPSHFSINNIDDCDMCLHNALLPDSGWTVKALTLRVARLMTYGCGEHPGTVSAERLLLANKRVTDMARAMQLDGYR